MSRGIRFEKRYVRATVELSSDGHMTPLVLHWPDGRQFPIDEVLNCSFSSSSKTGSSGMRYSVKISGQTKTIWRDGRGFFVETPCQMPF